MSQQNVDIVRRGYRLYEAGDLQGAADLFRDDAELPDAGGLGVGGTAAGRRQGPGGFLRATEEVAEAFEHYRVEPEEFIDAGEAVVVPVRISGRGKASAAKLEMHVTHLWVLREGKVIRGDVYRSTEEALVAAGGLCEQPTPDP
jgi:ketosteroid isomerase-like protein